MPVGTGPASPVPPTAPRRSPHIPPNLPRTRTAQKRSFPPAPHQMLPIERVTYIEVQVESLRRVNDLSQHFLAGERGKLTSWLK